MKKGIICGALLLSLLTSCNVVSLNSDSGESKSGNLSVGTSTSKSQGGELPVFEVFDVFGDRDNGRRADEFKLEEFGDSPFKLESNGELTNGTCGADVSHAQSLFVKDVNNDGYRDFCMVSSSGSGVVYFFVEIYDLHNREKIFTLSERQCFSYFLSIDDGDLAIRRVKQYYDDEEYGRGVFRFDKSRGVYVEWENKYHVNDFSFSIASVDPNHTPLRLEEERGVYNAIADASSTYFISIDIDAQDASLLPDYPIVSVNMGTTPFTWWRNGSKSNSTHYEGFFFFSGDDQLYTVDINVSGIEKMIVFGISDIGTEPTKIKDLYPWARNVTTDTLSSFRYDVVGGARGFRTIYRSSSKNTISLAVRNLNLIAYECDPSFFVNIERLSTANGDRSYYYVVDGVENVIKTISSVLIVGEKYYFIRESMLFGSAEEIRYGFDERTLSITMKAAADGFFDKIVTDLGDFEFAEKTSNHRYTKENAKYSFVAGSTEYYVISPKVFISSDLRYEYEITTARDFSELFE